MSEFIVIGAGVNGLACALELARSGHRVKVLEQRAGIGGLSARRTFGDGFEVPGVRHDTSEIRPSLIDSLGLGLTMLPEHEPIFASDNADGFVLHVSPDAAREEIGRKSKKDVEAYASFRGLLGHLRPVLEPLLDRAPPKLLPTGIGEMFEMGLMGLKLRGLGQRDMTEVLRAAPMCVADWMREQFETEILSATLSFSAIMGDFVGPWSPGTAAMMIVREAVLVPGVRGGPAAVVDALEKALKATNVEIRTQAKVSKLRLDGSRVKGVTLEGGEELGCDAVIAACSPKQAMVDLLPPLSMRTSEHHSARTIRSRGTAAKVHLALRGYPTWRGRPGVRFDRARLGGAHLDDLERAFDATKYRQLPQRPVLDVYCPTAHDSSRDTQVLSIIVHAVPHDLEGGWNDAAKSTLLDAVLTTLEASAPGTRDLVKASEVLSPVDLEREFGLPGGSLHHVERALDQMVLTRPARPFARYATPIEGLFLGSSGCHPGPGVTLGPGVFAARAATGRRDSMLPPR